MTLLALCLVVTFVGPLLANVTRRSTAISEAVDSFIVVTLAGLVLFHLVPQGLAIGGFYAGLAGVFGLALPTVFERLASTQSDRYGQRSMLFFALTGLLLHALMDGAALGLSNELLHHDELPTTNHDHGEHHHEGTHGSSLFLGVLLHRLPVALGVFWMGSRWRGPVTGWVAIVALAVATSLGFGLADDVVHTLDSAGVAIFQTFVAASLLHVIMDNHSPLHHSATNSPDAGTCSHHHHHHGHIHIHAPAHEPFENIPKDYGPETSGHETTAQNAQASRSMQRSQVPICPDEDKTTGEQIARFLGVLVAVAVLFALSHTDTPIASPESLSTLETLWVLLTESAPALLFAYLGAGLLTSFFGEKAKGWLGGTTKPTQALRGIAFGLPMPVCSCGVLPLYETLARRGVPPAAGLAFLIATPELGLDALLISLPLLGTEFTLARVIAAAVAALCVAVVAARVVSASPAPELAETHTDTPLVDRLRSGLRFGFRDLVDHTGPWILVGLVIAAIIEPVVDYEQLASLSGYIDVLLFALLGIPLYVCASGATPLAAVLIHKGVSPGAALAFLLTGPATNITTFGVLSRLHGKRTAWIFGLTMTIVAVTIGFITNTAMGSRLDLSIHHLAHHSASPLQATCLCVLALLFGASMWRRGPRAMLGEVFTQEHIH